MPPPVAPLESFQADSATKPMSFPFASKFGVKPVPPTATTLGSAAISLTFAVPVLQVSTPLSPVETNIEIPCDAPFANMGSRVLVKKLLAAPQMLKLMLIVPHLLSVTARLTPSDGNGSRESEMGAPGAMACTHCMSNSASVSPALYVPWVLPSTLILVRL